MSCNTNTIIQENIHQCLDMTKEDIIKNRYRFH